MQRGERGVEAASSAPVRFMVGLGGNLVEQRVQLIEAGGQRDTVAVGAPGDGQPAGSVP
ncbi:MAG TPA: hypothetical protein VF299_10110 [Mycobacterium sp.]